MKTLCLLCGILFGLATVNCQAQQPTSDTQPLKQVVTEGVVVTPSNSRKAQRQARERRRVAELARYLVEQNKFQFDVESYRYRGSIIKISMDG